MSSVRPIGVLVGALVTWFGTITLAGDADGEREGVDMTAAVG
jgi:hypothetical protein